ncbi:YceI family protein [Melioribacter sp. OK-6-Me]|uniref:YceI family protein n=1 Tax=unclassified Melioribacter TaxID=2627329 RepID=UPI003EDA7B91
MKILLAVLFFLTVVTFPQSKSTFYFKEETGKNQIRFFSTTPLEDINGTGDQVSGRAELNPVNLKEGIKGKIVLNVNSINTGIKLRNKHLQSSNWLDSKKYPHITYEVAGVEKILASEGNKTKCILNGVLTMHGISRNIPVVVEIVYLHESKETREIAEGDLIGVSGNFSIKLSDFGVENKLIGNKVAENIDIKFNLVGSTK